MKKEEDLQKELIPLKEKGSLPNLIVFNLPEEESLASTLRKLFDHMIEQRKQMIKGLKNAKEAGRR